MILYDFLSEFAGFFQGGVPGLCRTAREGLGERIGGASLAQT